MDILVTGSKGFLAKNLIAKLRLDKKINILEFNKSTKKNLLELYIKKAKLIFHFAAQNRSKKKKDFITNNAQLTKNICEIILKNNYKKKIIFSSSTQVLNKSIYGRTKLMCEKIIRESSKKNKSKFFIFRIPNIFGKWSRPNYNSVIATFCYNIARNKKVIVKNKKKLINFVYVDDLVDQFIEIIKYKSNNSNQKVNFVKIKKNYKATTDQLYKSLIVMKKNHNYFSLHKMNYDFLKKLYSTFLTFYPTKLINYKLKKNIDRRGYFSEFLKSDNFGQISYFTINVNKARGGHYHHSKVEKFVFLKGKVKIIYMNIENNKKKTFIISASENKVIETIPGWAHLIKNIGNTEVVGIIWSNEVFDLAKPDTYKYEINE